MRTENTVTVVALGQHYIIGCISITLGPNNKVVCREVAAAQSDPIIEVSLYVFHLCSILATMLMQLARMNPTLPNSRVKKREAVRNVKEKTNIVRLYL